MTNLCTNIIGIQSLMLNQWMKQYRLWNIHYGQKRKIHICVVFHQMKIFHHNSCYTFSVIISLDCMTFEAHMTCHDEPVRPQKCLWDLILQKNMVAVHTCWSLSNLKQPTYHTKITNMNPSLYVYCKNIQLWLRTITVCIKCGAKFDQFSKIYKK